MYLDCPKLALDSAHMALVIYRRHASGCQFHGRARRDSRSQKCQCPIWVQALLAVSTCVEALISFPGMPRRNVSGGGKRQVPAYSPLFSHAALLRPLDLPLPPALVR